MADDRQTSVSADKALRVQARDASAPSAATRPCLKGYSLSVTVEDGYYLKAYANPPEGELVGYGFQASISRKGVRDTLLSLVTDFYEDNLDV